jgi:hypothetical protein
MPLTRSMAGASPLGQGPGPGHFQALQAQCTIKADAVSVAVPTAQALVGVVLLIESLLLAAYLHAALVRPGTVRVFHGSAACRIAGAEAAGVRAVLPVVGGEPQHEPPDPGRRGRAQPPRPVAVEGAFPHRPGRPAQLGSGGEVPELAGDHQPLRPRRPGRPRPDHGRLPRPAPARRDSTVRGNRAGGRARLPKALLRQRRGSSIYPGESPRLGVAAALNSHCG